MNSSFTRLIFVGLAVLLSPLPVSATTWHWTGLDPSSSAWSRPQNWDLLSAPANDGTATVAFDDIPASARHDPVVDVPWTVEAIELNGDDAYSLSGARITTRAGITVLSNTSAGLQHVIANAIALLDDNVWTNHNGTLTLTMTGAVDLAGHDLRLAASFGSPIRLDGPISGTGRVLGTGVGRVRLAGNNTYTGGTTLVSGNFEIAGPNALPPGTLTLVSGNFDIGNSGGVIGPGASSLPGLVLGGVQGVSASLNGFPIVISTLGDWIVYDATDGPGEMLISGTLDLTTPAGTRVIRVGRSVTTTEEITVLAGIVNPSSVPGPAPAIRKLGPGRIQLGGINTYARALQIEEGEVFLLRPEAVGATGPGDPTIVLPSGALQLGSPVIIPSETLQLSGEGVEGTGALHALFGAHTWGGPVFLDADAAIGVDVDASVRITGAIGGTGGLAKVGDGALVLAAANSYVGNTRVIRGTLRLENVGGHAAPGQVIVENGGALAGDGSAGATITVLGGGAIEPAALGGATSSLGAQSVSFLSASTLRHVLIANGAGSRLDISGPASLAGRLELTLAPGFAPQAGHAFTLIHYASRTGTFTDHMLPPLASGLQWSLDYGTDALTARVVGVTAVGAEDALRDGIVAVGPSPFSTRVRIRYALSRAAHARLEVMDLGGRVVRRLEDSDLGPGRFEVEWNGADDRGVRVAGGVYFVRMWVDQNQVGGRNRLILLP